MSASFATSLGRAVASAFIASLLVVGTASADWTEFKGTYKGTWKSSDTDGKSYSGDATLKIQPGKGNSLSLTLRTSFLGNPITARGKAPANGKMSVTVFNPILGTVTGVPKATAGAGSGKISGSAPLYDGVAMLNTTLKSGKNSVTVKGTLVRSFPGLPPRTLNFSFAGKN